MPMCDESVVRFARGPKKRNAGRPLPVAGVVFFWETMVETRFFLGGFPKTHLSVFFWLVFGCFFVSLDSFFGKGQFRA